MLVNLWFKALFWTPHPNFFNDDKMTSKEAVDQTSSRPVKASYVRSPFALKFAISITRLALWSPLVSPCSEAINYEYKAALMGQDRTSVRHVLARLNLANWCRNRHGPQVIVTLVCASMAYMMWTAVPNLLPIIYRMLQSYHFVALDQLWNAFNIDRWNGWHWRPRCHSWRMFLCLIFCFLGVTAGHFL